MKTLVLLSTDLKIVDDAKGAVECDGGYKLVSLAPYLSDVYGYFAAQGTLIQNAFVIDFNRERAGDLIEMGVAIRHRYGKGVVVFMLAEEDVQLFNTLCRSIDLKFIAFVKPVDFFEVMNGLDPLLKILTPQEKAFAQEILKALKSEKKKKRVA